MTTIYIGDPAASLGYFIWVLIHILQELLQSTIRWFYLRGDIDTKFRTIWSLGNIFLLISQKTKYLELLPLILSIIKWCFLTIPSEDLLMWTSTQRALILL